MPFLVVPGGHCARLTRHSGLGPGRAAPGGSTAELQGARPRIYGSGQNMVTWARGARMAAAPTTAASSARPMRPLWPAASQSEYPAGSS
jgi:hypothetical protein